jgi:hypothetical protein
MIGEIFFKELTIWRQNFFFSLKRKFGKNARLCQTENSIAGDFLYPIVAVG